MQDNRVKSQPTQLLVSLIAGLAAAAVMFCGEGTRADPAISFILPGGAVQFQDGVPHTNVLSIAATTPASRASPRLTTNH